MSRNGAGTYSLPEAAFVSGTVISSTAVNSDFSDIANALTASIANDGQTPILANLPMSGYRHTGVGDASARTMYAAAGQVQDSAFTWCGTAGGTADALTLTPTPAIAAYATGQRFVFKASSSANTGAATVAISGLTAKAIQINDAALSAGYIAANKYYEVVYDGTAFQLNRLSAAYFDPTNVAYINVAQNWSKAQGCTDNTLTDGVTITPDLSGQAEGFVVLGGNRTLGVPSNLVAGKRQRFTFDVYQDSTGSRTLGYAWIYTWAGGTAGTLSTTALSCDKLFGDVRYYNTSTVTISIAAPGVVTWTSHGLKTGDRLQITTTGALPTGLTTSTTYFVVKNDNNSFWLATSLANAAASTRITTTGSQSGTHTAVAGAIDLTLSKAFA